MRMKRGTNLPPEREGWVKLCRSFVADGHLRRMTNAALRIWIHLRLTVNWRPTAGVEKGQRLVSYRELREETGMGLETISKALRELQDGGYIAYRPLGVGLPLLITVTEPGVDSDAETWATPEGQPVTDSGTRVTDPDTGVTEPVTPLQAGVPELETQVLPGQIRAVPKSVTPAGLNAYSDSGSEGREEEKNLIRKDNDDDHAGDTGVAAASETDLIRQVENYASSRTRSLTAGSADYAEIKRWVQMTGGNVQVICAGVDAGLAVYQKDKPGDYPRTARFYAGYVEKLWDRQKAEEGGKDGRAGAETIHGRGAQGQRAQRGRDSAGRFDPGRGGSRRIEPRGAADAATSKWVLDEHRNG
jgi:hypothetical protein